MLQNLRTFNSRGLADFESLIAKSSTGTVSKTSLLRSLTTLTIGEEFLEISPSQELILPDSFFQDDKYLTASSLVECEELSRYLAHLDGNAAMRTWSWLSAAWLVSWLGSVGSVDTATLARWIIRDEYNQYYRHPLVVPFTLLSYHGVDSVGMKFVLYGKTSKMSDRAEQLFARQDIAGSRSILDLAGKKFLAADGRPSAKSSAKVGRGTLRRFIVVIQQLMATYDLEAMDRDAIEALLPTEFE